MKVYIKEQRQQKGISLNELSRLSEISKSQIHYIENGITEPKVSTAMRIAKTLSTPVESLFSLEDE